MIIRAFLTYQQYCDHRDNPDALIDQVYAENAARGITYTCPYCGQDMYLRESINGVRFYACYPGRSHTGNTCKRLTHRKDVVETNIAEFDLVAFFNNMVIPERERHINPPPPGPDELEDDDQTENTAQNENNDNLDVIDTGDGDPEEQDPDDDIDEMLDEDEDGMDHAPVQIVPARSIRDILDLGYHRATGNTVINQARRITVSDVIIALPSLQALIDDPNSLNRQFRIIEMRAVMINYVERKIICRAFKKENSETYKYVYFYLTPNTRRQFESLMDKLFIKVETEYGNLKVKPRHKSVYVSGYWVISEKGHYFNEEVSPRFDTNIFKITRQVYSSPDDKF